MKSSRDQDDKVVSEQFNSSTTSSPLDDTNGERLATSDQYERENDIDNESNYQEYGVSGSNNNAGAYHEFVGDVMAVFKQPSAASSEQISITESNDDAANIQEGHIYSGLGNDVLAAFQVQPDSPSPQKKLLAVSGQHSLSSSQSNTVKESKSASGKILFKKIKLFGSGVESAKITEAKLGEGSNGDVFELELYGKQGDIRNNTTPKKCAIKTPKKKGSKAASDNLKKFFKVLDTLDKDKLKGLLIPYGTFHGRPSNTVYLCMPLADFDGDTLIELISGLSQEERDILIRYIVSTSIKTFSAMNELRIRHLDPKPSNFMFTSQGACLLGDFDSASVFDVNGDFLHTPEKFDNDSRFNPPDVLKKEDVSAVLNDKFKALDTYRLGLFFFLTCIARKDLIDSKLNAMTERPFPTINQLLGQALDDTKSIEAMLLEAKVEEEVMIIITGLLDKNAATRLTIEQASEMLGKIDLSLEEMSIKEIFAKLENMRQEQKKIREAEIKAEQQKAQDKEKEHEPEMEEEQEDAHVVEAQDLEKIFDAAVQNGGEIEGEDMSKIFHILDEAAPSDVTRKLCDVLERHKNSIKTASKIFEDSGKNVAGNGSDNQSQVKNAMAGLRACSLLSAAKRVTKSAQNPTTEQTRDLNQHHALAQSSFTAPILRKRPGDK